MDAGKLNRRVEVMQRSQVSDGSGGFEDALVLFKKVWSNIQPLSGREFWQAQQAQAEISHKVTIRYMKDVNRTHVLKFNDKEYDIQYIINVDEANRFLELHVRERQ